MSEGHRHRHRLDHRLKHRPIHPTRPPRHTLTPATGPTFLLLIDPRPRFLVRPRPIATTPTTHILPPPFHPRPRCNRPNTRPPPRKNWALLSLPPGRIPWLTVCRVGGAVCPLLAPSNRGIIKGKKEKKTFARTFALPYLPLA